MTYLIFLKMADEYARPPYGRDVGIPEGTLGRVSPPVAARSLKRTTLPQRAKHLRVANVHSNRLELDEIMEMGITENELRKTRLSVGDPLFVEGNGSIEQIGRVAIWDHKVPIA